MEANPLPEWVVTDLEKIADQTLASIVTDLKEVAEWRRQPPAYESRDPRAS